MSPKEKRPTVPPGVGMSGRRVWREVVEIYELEPSELLVLAEVCKTVDRLDALHAAVVEHGVVEESSQGLRTPLLVEERAQRTLLTKLITALGLPLGTIEGAAKGSAPVRGLYGITG